MMTPNIDKPRAYDCNLGPENICDCAYGQNYCARVKAAYPEVARYLDSLGVDIEKPFETSPLEPDENGYLEYCVCQYVVFGSCPEDFTHRIGDVTFGRSDCHPNTKVEEKRVALYFYPIRFPFEEPESGGMKCLDCGAEKESLDFSPGRPSPSPPPRRNTRRGTVPDANKP